MHTLTIAELQMKFAMLEDDLYQIQDMIERDSTRWEITHERETCLNQTQNKPESHIN
jgi:exonuclease V gamma subunit